MVLSAPSLAIPLLLQMLQPATYCLWHRSLHSSPSSRNICSDSPSKIPFTGLISNFSFKNELKYQLTGKPSFPDTHTYIGGLTPRLDDSTMFQALKVPVDTFITALITTVSQLLIYLTLFRHPTVLFLRSTLLRHNWQIIKYVHFKCIVQLVLTNMYTHVTTMTIKGQNIWITTKACLISLLLPCLF